MQVNYQGKDYDFNLEDITVSQAKQIKVHTGFTLTTLEDGLEVADPGALQAIFWLMKIHNGEAIPLERVDFKIVEFANALQKASEAEAKAEEEKAEAEKAAGVPVEAPKDPA